MKKVRPHHVICLSRLYPALSIFSQNKELYYDCIKSDLILTSNLRSTILHSARVTWGTIYNHKVMQVLSEIIIDNTFITSTNTCDSICSVCYGNIDGKCVGEDSIQMLDNISTDILNLKNNTLMKVSDLTDNDEFDKVCNRCGIKEKCERIRRATKKESISA